MTEGVAMKKLKIFLTVVISALTLIPAVYSQATFEGELVIQTSGMGGNGNLNYFVKGNMIRVNMSTQRGEANMIVDNSQRKMYMILPSAKMYMEFPMGKIKSNNNESPIKIEKTNEKKNINGYNCVKWVLKGDNGNTEAWLTKELGRFTAINSPMGRKSHNVWENEIAESGEFPMLVIQKNNDGKETSRFEIKSVEKKKLNDSFFAVPQEYKKMDMPMRGMK